MVTVKPLRFVGPVRTVTSVSTQYTDIDHGVHMAVRRLSYRRTIPALPEIKHRQEDGFERRFHHPDGDDRHNTNHEQPSVDERIANARDWKLSTSILMQGFDSRADR